MFTLHRLWSSMYSILDTSTKCEVPTAFHSNVKVNFLSLVNLTFWPQIWPMNYSWHWQQPFSVNCVLNEYDDDDDMRQTDRQTGAGGAICNEASYVGRRLPSA